jgi:hypothetical protein
MAIKISELTPKGDILEATDLLEISQDTPDGYISKSITGAEILDDTQAHVPTDKGVIFCDTSMSVNEITYDNINDFLTALYA